MRRSSGKTQDVAFWQRISRNRWRINWIRVGYFPGLFVIKRFFKRSSEISKTTTTEPSSCQWSTTLIAQQEGMMRFAFRDYQKSFVARTLDVSWSWIGEEMVWRIFLLSHRRMGLISQWNGAAMHRNLSRCVWKHQCFEWWNPEEEKRFPNYSLKWRFCQTQNCCCRPFILEISSKCAITWSTTFGVSSDNGIRTTVCKKILWTSTHRRTEFSSQKCVKKLGLNIVFRSWWFIELDLTRTTVGRDLFHQCRDAENTHVLEYILNPECGSNSRRNGY